jgi:hypothetical protein
MDLESDVMIFQLPLILRQNHSEAFTSCAQSTQLPE